MKVAAKAVVEPVPDAARRTKSLTAAFFRRTRGGKTQKITKKVDFCRFRLDFFGERDIVSIRNQNGNVLIKYERTAFTGIAGTIPDRTGGTPPVKISKFNFNPGG